MGIVAWLDKPSNRHKVWRVNFTDHRRARRRLMGFRSKRASEQLGRNLEVVVSAAASGGDVPDQLAHWLRNQLDDKRKSKLVEWKILSPRHLLVGQSLKKHLDAWQKHLYAENATDHHCEQQHKRASVVFLGRCGFHTYTAIEATRVLTEISSMRKRLGWSRQTEMHYLKACKAFTRWMVRFERAARDPLAILDTPAIKAAEVKHARRALTHQECDVLIESTSKSPRKRGGMRGAQRSLIYRLVAYETGFRAGTIRSLRVCDFDISSDQPSVTGALKGGKRVCVPLTGGIVALLCQHLSSRDPDGSAFDAPTVSWFSDMFKADLADAGIPTKQYGKVLDFHALRHTFATMASKVMDPRTLQEIMGVTDIRIVMRFYSHRLTDDLAQAKTAMPLCGVQCGGNAPQNTEISTITRDGAVA